MAGGTARDRANGVGPALRKARLVRGVTIQEAARDTRLRAEQLEALEREDFAGLPGEVYVRGLLRTYAAYLGVNPDRVLAAYGRRADAPTPPPPPAKVGAIERAIAATRIRDNQRFLLIAAAALLVVFVAIGAVGRRSSAPRPADVPASTPRTSAASTEPVDVVLKGIREVQARIVVDGTTTTFALQPGESRSLEGAREVSVFLEEGSAAEVEVNGVAVDTAGIRGSFCMRYAPGEDPVACTDGA